MAKRPEPEGILAKLRQVDVLTAQGKPVAVRTIGVTELTYGRWREASMAVGSWIRCSG